jgi:glycosyltransferase involved in cell wall biosynthesis
MDLISLRESEDKDITFFVPCLNEESNVYGTLTNILNAVSATAVSYEILVVDDGSTDRTCDEVRRFQEDHPDAVIRLKKNAKNLGIGRNFAEGAYDSRGRHYMLVNGDNVEHYDTLVALLSHLGEADILVPHFGGKDQRPRFRQRISRTYTRIVNCIGGHTISYYNGPVVHWRRNVIRWHSDSHGFGYQAMLITRLLDEGASWLELEVRGQEREHGKSKAFRWKNFLSVAHSLSEMAIRRVRKALVGK